MGHSRTREVNRTSFNVISLLGTYNLVNRFRTITASYYRGANIVCLVCDLTSKESFNNFDMWRGEIDRYASDSAIKLLLANKSDLADKRTVSPEELQVRL